MTDQISTDRLNQFSSDEVVLSVQGISKKFCRSLKRSLFYGIQDIGSELVGAKRQSDQLREGEFWALQDISLELRRGEALGLVGANGSGKTTLLRMISGLIKPDTGSIQIRGRVAPLIALGAGFSPILTGRENVYANMSILGLSTREIEAQFDQVVEFAEIGEAIDAPVQSYSSGMAARLGFACAIHTNPDILLIDEVLAVGDARFRAKCERRLSELLQQGTAFVLVSHFFQGILNICSSGIYLANGRLMASGNAREVMDRYEQDLFSIQRSSGEFPFVLPAKPEADQTGADILSIYFRNAAGKLINAPATGESVYFCVRCKVNRPVQKLSLFLAIYQPSRDNNLALHLSSAYDNEMFEVAPGHYELRVHLPHFGLLPGSYSLNTYIKDGSLYVLDAYESLQFTVDSTAKLNRGSFYQPRQWQLLSSRNPQSNGLQENHEQLPSHR
ncbi:MAG TPA: ABC transporter ATP-binding protein [Trichocoleus sp.]|jgi:lipopolysaccharide transport system ATP-binding protein